MKPFHKFYGRDCEGLPDDRQHRWPEAPFPLILTFSLGEKGQPGGRTKAPTANGGTLKEGNFDRMNRIPNR